MDEWVRLVRAADCPIGAGRFVEARGHELAVFRLPDPERFIVIRNSCPHAGGNLAAGRVEGDCVTCPWHHWKFDLTTGACVLSDSARLTRYECRLEDGYVAARLPPKPTSPENLCML